MNTKLDEVRAALIDGARTCNLVSPATMNATQLGHYEAAHRCVEQLGELLVEAGDFRSNTVSLLDRIRRMR